MIFRDSQGQDWDTSIDLPAAKRVRDLVGVNLLTLHLSSLLQRLADPITLCEVFWAIVKPEADRAGLTQEQFLRRCAVDLVAAADQLLTGPEGLSAFFRQLFQTPKAEQLETIWTRTKTLETVPPEKTQTLIDETMDWMLSRILNKPSGDAVTKPPESSGSIPTSQA